MARKLTDAERIEQYFTSAGAGEAGVMLSKIQLILRVRGIIEKPAKRGRKAAVKAAPPISGSTSGVTSAPIPPGTQVRQ